MNIPLLNRIRDAAGGFVLPQDLGGSVEEVRRDIAVLEGFGFGIEWHPYYGVAYRSPARRLCPDQIEFDLKTQVIGKRIAVWNRVTSTNDLAATASQSRSNEGLVVLAEEQTEGRGQRGRQWSASAETSILMSLLIFPPEKLAEPAWLTALGALAVADLVAESTGRKARIKWSNDVRVDGKKVAGVLVERGQGAVIGIGLNVNIGRDDFPPELLSTATSIQILASGIPQDRSELVRSLLRFLDARYTGSLDSGPQALAHDWGAASEHLGRCVRINTPEGPREGTLEAIDFDRGLVLRQGGSETAVALQQVLSLTERAVPE